jgi:hypothetical protein
MLTVSLGKADIDLERLDEILGVIEESVDIIEIMKPIYNFKMANERC